jgi:Ca2+-binding RTX toxin-like protein
MSVTDFLDFFGFSEPATTFGFGLATAGPDTFPGNVGDDFAFGIGGDDRLAGAGGNDILVGGDGKDNLFASTAAFGDPSTDNAGNLNFIEGGPGNDSLRAGAGTDVFYFDNNSGQDTIFGFNPAVDVIVVRANINGLADIQPDLTVNATGGAAVVAHLGFKFPFFGTAVLNLSGAGGGAIPATEANTVTFSGIPPGGPFDPNLFIVSPA